MYNFLFLCRLFSSVVELTVRLLLSYLTYYINCYKQDTVLVVLDALCPERLRGKQSCLAESVQAASATLAARTDK